MRRRAIRRDDPRAEFKGSEAALCDVLAERAKREGFRVVPECSGWDMILVEPETEEQIGVQAKLRAGLDVLGQSIVAPRRRSPDVVAVLVPAVTVPFSRIASELRIGVFTPRNLRAGLGPVWMLRSGPRREIVAGRCWVPPVGVEVEIPAGVPSPRTISPWKLAAARLCLRLRAGEVLTRSDFASAGVRVDNWIRAKQVVRVDGERGRYVIGGPEVGGLPLPDERMPEVVEAIRRSLAA
jgi:hypothetical protein